MKYLELFKNGFDDTITEKIKPENWPYIGYSPSEGFAFTVIPEENQLGYQMVDLGLSVKWADRNVGADTPQDNGLYFSWGNVDGHAVDENSNTADGYSFDSDTYATTLGGQYTDSALDTGHDAATANMGSDWRMPTVDETIELVENTDHYYIDEAGNVVEESNLDGSELCSVCFVKQGEAFDYENRSNFIEIPFTGGFIGSLLDGEGLAGIVWTSYVYDTDAEFAYFLGFKSDSAIGDYYYPRYFGLSVRAVHD